MGGFRLGGPLDRGATVGLPASARAGRGTPAGKPTVAPGAIRPDSRRAARPGDAPGGRVYLIGANARPLSSRCPKMSHDVPLRSFSGTFGTSSGGGPRRPTPREISQTPQIPRNRAPIRGRPPTSRSPEISQNAPRCHISPELALGFEGGPRRPGVRGVAAAMHAAAGEAWGPGGPSGPEVALPPISLATSPAVPPPYSESTGIAGGWAGIGEEGPLGRPRSRSPSPLRGPSRTRSQLDFVRVNGHSTPR